MGDKRSSRARDSMQQLISSRDPNGSIGNDSRNVTTSESQDSFVVPLAFGVDKLRLTSDDQQQRYLLLHRDTFIIHVVERGRRH